MYENQGRKLLAYHTLISSFFHSAADLLTGSSFQRQSHHFHLLPTSISPFDSFPVSISPFMTSISSLSTSILSFDSFSTSIVTFPKTHFCPSTSVHQFKAHHPGFIKLHQPPMPEICDSFASMSPRNRK